MNDNSEIIALNGLTGECLTIDDLDDWTQRLKEDPPEPELTPEQMEAIRQEHEPFLTQLEAFATMAIASGDWTPVLEHLNEIMAWQDGKLPRCPKSQKPALIDCTAPALTTTPQLKPNLLELNPS